jgi:hypothetical protein
MSAATMGINDAVREKHLVPGDYVFYERGDVLSSSTGDIVLPYPEPIRLTEGPMKFSDPHKETVDKISKALGHLLQDQIPSKELINRRDWR